LTNIRVPSPAWGWLHPGKGRGPELAALLDGETGIGRLTLFPTAKDLSFPVGEVTEFFANERTPRTHQTGPDGGEEAVEHSEGPPDAIVMGSTTGGMSRTEALSEGP
jgi:hypothetical protein